MFPAYPTAPAALILMVPFTFALFSWLPPYRAAFLSFLIGTLVLPVDYGWDIPGVARIDKATIPLFASVAATAVLAPKEFSNLRLRGATLWFILVLAIGAFMTAYTNGDPYSVAGVVLPGLTSWDGVAMLRRQAFVLIFPFLLGRMLVRDVRQLSPLLRALVVGFLIYSIPMLWEVRMSPQLHNSVYGYLPASFLQQIRAGGYRPVVFVGHGLPLAIMTSFAIVASSVLWRRGVAIRGMPPALVTAYLAGLLALCKTLSALVYAVVGSAVVFFCSAKTQLRTAVTIACIVLAYPMLRSLDLFPTDLLTQISETASSERASSLAFRFKNEDLLLGHARERWAFGWGGYGRDRILSIADTDEGEAAVSDGLWIIFLGQNGAAGFLGVFGLMLWPIFLCARALKNVRGPAQQRLLASFAFLIALNWADSLPNALSGGVVMVFATGAFAGVVDANQRPRREPVQEKKPVDGVPSYDAALAR
jgi:hypothetical protein